jgi:hypothetical protein
MNRFVQQAKLFWAGLPHQYQACVVVFATAAGTTLGRELQELLLGSESFTWLCLRHDLAAAAIAGAIALKTFYMFPNRTVPAQTEK